MKNLERNLVKLVLCLITSLAFVYTCSAVTSPPPGDNPPLPDGTPPDNAMGFSASALAGGSVELVWVQPSNDDFKNVEITWTRVDGMAIVDGDGESQPVIVNKETTTKEITGLMDGVTYTFTIKSVDTVGNKSTGFTATATSDSTAPDDVTVTASAASEGGSVELAWTNPTNADFASVSISWTPMDGEIQPVEITNGTTTREITGLTDGTEYTFTIKSVDMANNKSAGVSRMATPADTAPDDITGFTASALAGGSVKLAWTNPTNADFASVLISWTPMDGEIQPVEITNGTTTREITGLTDGTEYTFTIKSVDTAGNKSTGFTATATSDSTPPNDVIITSAVAPPEGSSVDLTWTNPTDLDSFDKILISWTPMDGEMQPIEITDKTVTTRSIPNLTNGVPYTFTIKSVDTAGNESTGVTIMATPADMLPPADVTGFTASAPSEGGSVELAWTNPTNADFASVLISWSPTDGEMQPVEITNGTTTREITGLTDGTEYTFTIKSVDMANNKSAGVMATATSDSTAPADVMNVTSTSTENSVTLTWEDPMDTDLANISINWTGGSTGTHLAIGEGMGMTMIPNPTTISNLTIGADYTFTLTAVDRAGNQSSVTTHNASTKYIALFSLGVQDADFGFNACQTALTTNTGIGARLAPLGYTQARFFGSTDTYDFINIATDADALGTGGTAITGDISVFPVDNTADIIRTFGTSSSAVTLAELLDIGTNFGSFQNGGENVLEHLGITRDLLNNFWSFTTSAGVYDTKNCDNASSNDHGLEGTGGRFDLVGGVNRECRDVTTATHVLCIAR